MDLEPFVAKDSIGVHLYWTDTARIQRRRSPAHRQNPLPRSVALLAAKHTGQRVAIELCSRWNPCSSQLGKCRQHIGEVGQGVGDNTSRNNTGGVDNKRLPWTILGQQPLPTANHAITHPCTKSLRRTVVSREKDHCSATEFQAIDRRHKPPHKPVGVADHRLVFFQRRVRFRLGRRVHDRPMGQHHREIDQHRTLAIVLEKLHQKIGKHIRTKTPPMSPAFAAAGVDVRIPVPLATGWHSRFVASPHAPGIKTMLPEHIGLNAKVVDLPLAGDGRLVTGRFQHASKCQVVPRIKMTTRSPSGHIPVIAPAVMKRVLAGQQRGPRGCALWHRVRIGEPHAAGRQRINVRRLQFTAAITPNPLRAKVVDHDEDDVGTLGGKHHRGSQQQNRKMKSHENTHAQSTRGRIREVLADDPIRLVTIRFSLPPAQVDGLRLGIL